jgi:glycine/D-amino acid oxidase-like deaminating enzyme
MDGTPSAATAPLPGSIDADVVIVGAGYTGLSTALALREEGREAVVLEAETAGFGASGRNAGHLTPTIGKDIPTLLRLYGRRRTGALLNLAETGIRYVEGLIARGVECDYAPVGNVIAAVHPRQHANVDRAARAAGELGIHGELLAADAMRARGLPRAFTRGFLEPLGGVLDPGRYVRGLRALALDAGATLFERTPVERIELGRPLIVHARAGRIRARRVVVATNAYTPRLGLLRSRILALRVQLFRTAPLGASQRAAVGWPGREGIYTAHEVLESYRLTADDRIVGGSKFVRYGYGGRELADVDAGIARRLETTFRKRFPELGDVAITDHWGGPIGFTLNFLPALGRLGPDGDVVYAVGYAGHGVALATYAGRMVCDLLHRRDGPGAALWKRAQFPLPPEPLRWLLARGLTGLLGALDRRVDRSVP